MAGQGYRDFRLFFAGWLVCGAAATAHEIGHEHEHSPGGWHSEAGFVSDADHTARLFSPRGKTQEEIVQRAMWLAEQYDVQRSAEQEIRAAEARKKYAAAVVINSLLPSSVGIVNNTYATFKKGLQRNRDAGMTLVSSTVYAFPSAISETATAYSIIASSNEVARDLDLVEVDSVNDVLRAKKTGAMGLIYNTQGADYVVGDLAGQTRQSYDHGIRVMNFSYNRDNALAGGGFGEGVGLTALGSEWLATAQREGMVIDVSHSSDETAIDAANRAKKPIIASHSNASALLHSGRNLSDAAIEAIGRTGGVVCPNGVGLFLHPQGEASPEIYVEHVLHIANLIGRAGVCFSTDYVHNILDYYVRDIPNVSVYPPELGFGAPTQNLGPEHIWDIVALLEDEHQWTDAEIIGFLGGNLLRVYQANWQAKGDSIQE
ncbi:MAG: membrane dipeptidase [Cellvibrionales bacterium]|jgi:microsomal dipeptidase-like Zn-dependent dipeptidase